MMGNWSWRFLQSGQGDRKYFLGQQLPDFSVHHRHLEGLSNHRGRAATQQYLIRQARLGPKNLHFQQVPEMLLVLELHHENTVLENNVFTYISM